MPLDPKKKPDMEEFDRYSRYMEGMWSNAFEDMRVIDGIYFQTEDFWADYYNKYNVPPVLRTRPTDHSGVATALVEQAVSAYLPLSPTFHRAPNGRGSGHEEAAGRLERGLQAAYYDSMLHTAQMPTVENGKQIQMYNHTIKGTLLDTESVVRPYRREGENTEDFEKREHEWEKNHITWNPIRILVPKMGEVLMDPREAMPGVAIQRQTMKAYEVHALSIEKDVKRTLSRDARYTANSGGVLYSLIGRDAYDDVDVEKWWSERWFLLRIKDGDIIYAEPNMWGIQPFSQIFGGNAVMPSSQPWDVRWWIRQSMLWREIPTIRMINRNLVSQQMIILRKAWARLGYAGEPAEAANQLIGNIMGGEKDDWWVEQTPDLAPQSAQFLETLQGTLERTSFSGISAGFRQTGIDTATGMIIADNNAKNTFKANISQLEKLDTSSASNFMKLLDSVHEEFQGANTPGYDRIKVGKDELRVDDIGRKYHIRATYKQVDPVVRQAEIQQAMVLYEAGLVGDEYIYRVAGIEDETGTRKDAIKSIARRDPEVIEQLKIDAFREEGLHEIADRRQAALDQVKASRLAQEFQVSPQSVNGNGRNGF